MRHEEKEFGEQMQGEDEDVAALPWRTTLPSGNVEDAKRDVKEGIIFSPPQRTGFRLSSGRTDP